MSGLERVPKTGAYRYRRGIPVHLRAYFPDKGTVWREHLNTKVEHEARVRCLEVAARVERLFQQAQADFDATRQEKVPETSTLSIELLTAVVADWKRQERSRRAQHVLVRPIMPGWSDFLRECTVLGICGQKPNAEEPEAFMARLSGRWS